MLWIQNLILSTLLLLTTYALIQQQQFQSRLVNLQQQQQAISGTLTDTLKPVTEQITAVQTGVDKLNKAADDANNKALKSAKMHATVVQALADVAQADLLRVAQQGKEAAEKIKAAKKPLWAAGDFYAAQKTRLQGLMGPIDKLSGAWAQGTLDQSAVDVRKELNAILGELGND